jgi:hypothetical protein
MRTHRKVVRLSVVRNERKASEARRARQTLYRCARNASSAHGIELSGFALVTWDRHGMMHTALYEGYGPVAWGRIPHEVETALSQHICTEMAQNNAAIDPFDFEPEGA